LIKPSIRQHLNGLFGFFPLSRSLAMFDDVLPWSPFPSPVFFLFAVQQDLSPPLPTFRALILVMPASKIEVKRASVLQGGPASRPPYFVNHEKSLPFYSLLGPFASPLSSLPDTLSPCNRVVSRSP